VVPDGAGGKGECSGDLGVGPALHEVAEDVELAGGEPRGIGPGRSPRTALRGQPSTVAEVSDGPPAVSATAAQNARPIAAQAALALRARPSRINANGSSSAKRPG
jgi:hypothetical protein